MASTDDCTPVPPPQTGAPTPPPTPAAKLASTRDVVPFRTAVRTWFAISLQTFGGPAGQIAVMQRVLVDERAGSGSAGSSTP